MMKWLVMAIFAPEFGAMVKVNWHPYGGREYRGNYDTDDFHFLFHVSFPVA
jgi:hypothetical protein